MLPSAGANPSASFSRRGDAPAADWAPQLYDAAWERVHRTIEFTKERILITPQNIRVGVPEFPFDSDAVNEPSCYDMITKHAMQIPTFRFHNKTANLRDYEELFEHFKSSFIVPRDASMQFN